MLTITMSSMSIAAMAHDTPLTSPDSAVDAGAEASAWVGLEFPLPAALTSVIRSRRDNSNVRELHTERQETNKAGCDRDRTVKRWIERSRPPAPFLSTLLAFRMRKTNNRD